jgi:hypothetical protein
MTPDERAKILKSQQVVKLKSGFIERSLQYCESADQLCRLLQFVNLTLVTRSVSFAEGDPTSVQLERMAETVREFLGTE